MHRVSLLLLYKGDEKASWDECMDYATETLGLDPEDAYDSLAASFGWTPRSKAFWKTKKEVVPTVEEVQNTVSYLKAKIGFSDEDITKVARDFPQALGLSESDIDYTVNHMQVSACTPAVIDEDHTTSHHATLGCAPVPTTFAEWVSGQVSAELDQWVGVRPFTAHVGLRPACNFKGRCCQQHAIIHMEPASWGFHASFVF